MSDAAAFVPAVPLLRQQATAALHPRWSGRARLASTAWRQGLAVRSAAAPRIRTPHATLAPEAASATGAPNASPEASLKSYRPTAAARARTVVHICQSATLCTASSRHSGVPFGSHVDYVQDDQGNPVFLLAKNANHTKNLLDEPRCSLFCQPASSAGQEGCRATLVGEMSALPEDQVEELRELYIDVHTHAAEALQFRGIFQFYRMTVEEVLFVAGYGVTSQWVHAADFADAQPDPLAFDAPSILGSLNKSKQADLNRLGRIFLNIPDVVRCTMTSLDRLGFDLRVRGEHSNTKEYRIAFREVVSNRFDVQSALVKAFQEAWERENGFDETWIEGSQSHVVPIVDDQQA